MGCESLLLVSRVELACHWGSYWEHLKNRRAAANLHISVLQLWASFPTNTVSSHTCRGCWKHIDVLLCAVLINPPPPEKKYVELWLRSISCLNGLITTRDQGMSIKLLPFGAADSCAQPCDLCARPHGLEKSLTRSLNFKKIYWTWSSDSFWHRRRNYLAFLCIILLF